MIGILSGQDTADAWCGMLPLGLFGNAKGGSGLSGGVRAAPKYGVTPYPKRSLTTNIEAGSRDITVLFHRQLSAAWVPSAKGGQTLALSAKRCRAAWRDTPRAKAMWFQDRPRARARTTASRRRASSARTASAAVAISRRSSVPSTWAVSGSSESTSCSKRLAACSISLSVWRVIVSSSEKAVELRS